LIGGPLDDTATTVAHIAGAGLIGLALACWPGKGANSSLHAALTAMLAYNVLATLVLGDAAITGQATGKLLWWGDDIGIWNISHFSRGMMGYRTPNIDRVAEEGVTFTDYYASRAAPPAARASSPARIRSAPA
jgi:hypothetical protein